MENIFGRGSLIKLKVRQSPVSSIVSVDIGLGASDLPPTEFLNYSEHHSLFQAWVDLFYNTMQDLWHSDTTLDTNENGK